MRVYDKDIIKTAVRISANAFGLDSHDVFSKTRKREYVRSRQVACYLIRKTFGNRYSLTVLGYEIGNKDHASVVHSVKTISNLVETESDFRKLIDELMNEFRGLVFDESIFQLVEKAKIQNLVN